MKLVYTQEPPKSETKDLEILDVLDSYPPASNVIPTNPPLFQRVECYACGQIHRNFAEMFECYEKFGAKATP